MNYTKEQTKYLIDRYTLNPSKDTVEELANELEKSTKSIIGKLSREKVYRREVYKAKTGERPVTKVELVNNIADILDVPTERLEGLEKSPKEVLKLLIDSLPMQ